MIELTREEAQALLGLIDAGVKQLGLNAATAAAVILQKIMAAYPQEPVEQE